MAKAGKRTVAAKKAFKEATGRWPHALNLDAADEARQSECNREIRRNR